MLCDDPIYSFTLKMPTVYKTHKLVFSYKKLILSAAVFYLVAGLSLYACIDVYHHPQNVLLSVMSLVSNSIFFSISLMSRPFLIFMAGR